MAARGGRQWSAKEPIYPRDRRWRVGLAGGPRNTDLCNIRPVEGSTTSLMVRPRRSRATILYVPLANLILEKLVKCRRSSFAMTRASEPPRPEFK